MTRAHPRSLRRRPQAPCACLRIADRSAVQRRILNPNVLAIGNQVGAGADVRVSAACCVHIVCEADCFWDVSDGTCPNC